MNISTEPRHRSKTVQPIPDYNQDAEHVTEILVDISQNNVKPILKNQGFYTTAPHSPPKDQPINPIRAGIIRSPTMDVAPDSHQQDRSRGPGPTYTQFGDKHLQTKNQTNKEISSPRTLRSIRDTALTHYPH